MKGVWTLYEADGDDYIDMERWGKDHWSTFAYLETVTVDKNGIVKNEKMRCNPRLHREFAHVYPFSQPITDGSEYPTRLKDGEVEKHDDWSCLEDMVYFGLLTAEFRRKNNKIFGCCEAWVKLTDKGKEIAAKLRQHIAEGGKYHTFEYKENTNGIQISC